MVFFEKRCSDYPALFVSKLVGRFKNEKCNAQFSMYLHCSENKVEIGLNRKLNDNDFRLVLEVSCVCVSLTESLKILSIGRNNIKSLAGIVSLFIIIVIVIIIIISIIIINVVVVVVVGGHYVMRRMSVCASVRPSVRLSRTIFMFYHFYLEKGRRCKYSQLYFPYTMHWRLGALLPFCQCLSVIWTSHRHTIKSVKHWMQQQSRRHR